MSSYSYSKVGKTETRRKINANQTLIGHVANLFVRAFIDNEHLQLCILIFLLMSSSHSNFTQFEKVQETEYHLSFCTSNISIVNSYLSGPCNKSSDITINIGKRRTD